MRLFFFVKPIRWLGIGASVPIRHRRSGKALSPVPGFIVLGLLTYWAVMKWAGF